MLNIKKYQPRPVEIIDTTLREGLQSPLLADAGKYSLSSDERIELSLTQMKYGVRFFEVFSPVVNKQEKENLALLIEASRRYFQESGQPAYILAHVRCHPKDIEEAVKAGVHGLNLYIGTSAQLQTFNHGRNLDEIVKTAKPLIKNVRKNYPNIFLRFSGEDAFRTPIEDLYKVYDPIVEFVDRLGTPDTVGTATPQMVERRVAELKKRYPHTSLEGHFHNDRGLALINAVSAVKAGMEYIQTTVLGIGERSGITSLTGLLFNLYLEDPKLLTGFNIEQSYVLNVLLASMLGIQVPTTEPVSLTNRTHFAGPHTSAVIKGDAYEAHDLAKFGVNEQKLLLGPLSGWHVVRYYLTHVLYYRSVSEETAKEVVKRFKQRVYELDSRTPTDLLKEIADSFPLARLSRPVSHEENLR